MSTWGDRKRSRFRTRRLARRFAAIAAVMALVGSILFISVLVALRSETVWRRFLLPRYLGPYWDTALSWDNFQPRMFPPGIAIENLEIREPGSDAPPAVTIGLLDLQLDYGALLGGIDLRAVEVRDFQLHIRKYNLKESNLSRAMDRVVEGRPTKATSGPARPFPEIAATSFQITGFGIRYENVMDPATQLGLSFGAITPVTVVIPKSPRGGDRPMLTDLVQIRALGSLQTVVGDPLTLGLLDISIDIPSLRDFPANIATATATLSGPAPGPHRVEFRADLPLEAAPFRLSAIESTNIDIRLTSEARTTPIAAFRKGFLDPFSGELEGEILVDATSAELTAALLSLLDPATAGTINTAIDSNPHLAWARPGPRSFDVYTSATISGRGLMQYAIIDEAELEPIELRTRGIVRGEGVPLPGLEEFASTLLGEEAVFTGSLSAEWLLEIDRRRGHGAAWFRSTTKPTFLVDDRLELGLRLHHPDDPEAPVRFNPFAEGLAEAFASAAPTYGNYDVLPQWEESLSEVAPVILGAFAALDRMGLRDGVAAVDVTVESGELTARLLAPVLQQIEDAGNGQFSVAFSRHGDLRPAGLTASARVRGVRLAEIEDAVLLDGELDIVRDGSRLVARTANVRISRAFAEDAPVVFELGLPGEGPMGELGPPAPTFVDLERGTAHFEVAATTIRREVLEILLRVQTFNLSEQLAQPLYQQMLSMLGFDPTTREIGARADIYMTGDIGEVARVNSHFQIGGVPVATFLMLPEEAKAIGEKLDVRLLQGAQLDRRSAILTPEKFDLRISMPETPEPFLLVYLEADETIALDYDRLVDFAADEVILLTRQQAAASIKQLAARSLGRVARFEKALISGAGSFIFEVPGFEMARWTELLDAAGVPIESGLLEARIAARVLRGDDTEQTEATGRFAFHNIKFSGVAAPIPLVEGELEIEESNSEILLRILRTRFAFDNEYNPTTISFRGRAKTDSFESEWKLDIEEINSSVLAVLERLRRAGIDRATTVLQAMPTQLVAPRPGDSGRVDLSFAASSNEAGNEVILRAIQSGEGLVVIPRLLRPLSFRLAQQMTISDGTTFQIDELEGWLREEDVPEDLLLLELDNPIIIGSARGPSGDAVIRVTAQRDLARLRDRLARFPIPLIDRTIEGGLLRGVFEVEIPEGTIETTAHGLSVANSVEFSVNDLRLSGYEMPIDGTIRGRIEKRGSEVRLAPLSFWASVGEEPIGELRLVAAYQIGKDELTARFDAIELRPLLIGALPETFSRWASLEDSRLNLQADVNAAFATGNAATALRIRARNMALPPVSLREGFNYAAPPLNLDLDFESDWNSAARVATISKLDALATKGHAIPGDRLDRLSDTGEVLLRLGQSSPVAYNLRTRSFFPDNPEGVSLWLDVGPVDLAEFAPLFLQLYGLPMTKGTFSGNARVEAGATYPLRRDALSVAFALEDGKWRHSDGEEEAVNATLDIAGELLPDVIRLNRAGVRLEFPDQEEQPVDALSLSGYLYRTGEPRRAELDLFSEGMDLARLIRLAGAIGPVDPREGQAETDYDAVLRRARPFDATVNAEFRNLLYRQVSIPAIRLRATAKENKVTLHQLRSRLAEGDVLVTGEADLSRGELPWALEASLTRLELRPWIESFSSPGRLGSVGGELSGRLLLRGEGVDPDRLGDSLDGEASIQLRRLDIQNAAIRWLAGTQARLEADGTLLIRNNVARFRVDTPWHPEFSLLTQGIVRPVLPPEGEQTHYRGMVRYEKMSAVAPKGRTMEHRGEVRPFRQRLYGILMEVSGNIGEGSRPEVSVRSLNY